MSRAMERNARRAAPPWLTAGPRPEDAEHLRALTPDQRLELFVEALELATAILRGRADAESVLARGDPWPPALVKLWRRLKARHAA